MGYFDGLVDGSFKPLDDGTMLFYPNGVRGKGYIIPTAQRTQEIRQVLKRMTIVGFAVIILSCWVLFSSIIYFGVPWWLALIVYGLVCVGVIWFANAKIKEWTSGLALTDQKLSLRETRQAAAKSFGPVTLWGLVILGTLMTLAALSVLLDGRAEWDFRLAGLVGLLMGGASVVSSVYFMWLRSGR